MDPKTEAAPDRPKQVETELKGLGDQIESLSGLVLKLEESLFAVLSNPIPQETGGEEQCELCECAQAIRSNREVILSMNNRLLSLLDRLEV